MKCDVHTRLPTSLRPRIGIWLTRLKKARSATGCKVGSRFIERSIMHYFNVCNLGHEESNSQNFGTRKDYSETVSYLLVISWTLSEVCDGTDRAAYYHILGSKLGISTQNWHFASIEAALSVAIWQGPQEQVFNSTLPLVNCHFICSALNYPFP